jgi:signal transduction histidine kinase
VDVTRAREADRLKDEFVATVSHELRTPLTSISGFVDLLLDGAAGPLPPRSQRYLQLMRRNSQRLAALIDDLLDLSRIEAGRLTLRRTTIELPSVIQTVVASVEPQLVAKEQRLRVEVADDLPTVLADGERIAQVLGNLLSNAHKYTPADGAILVRAAPHDHLVRVEVTDTGIGLSREEQALVFTRFFRADHQAVKDAGGTGLGLAIARALVELHGGTIDVTSVPGEGATFGFTLPIVPPPERRAPRRPSRRMPPFRPN